MKKAIQLTAAALALTAFGAHAQSSYTEPSRLYGSIGYESIGLRASSGGVTAKSDPGLLMGTIGYQLHPNIAIEGIAGGTVRKDDLRLNGFDSGLDSKVDTYGVFVKPSVNLTENFSLFGRVGYARTNASLSTGNFSVNDSTTDVAYGVGAAYNLTPRSYVQANYTQYLDKDNVQAKGWGVHYGLRF
jgi:opacity protein-like surface antigen